jgi:hypothetical protein
VAAVGLPILGLNREGVNAVDGYFHVGGIYWIKKTIR